MFLSEYKLWLSGYINLKLMLVQEKGDLTTKMKSLP